MVVDDVAISNRCCAASSNNDDDNVDVGDDTALSSIARVKLDDNSVKFESNKKDILHTSNNYPPPSHT